MSFLSELWLPIVLSAVFVFVVSSVIHMAVPWHKGDWKKVKSEDAMLDALRAAGLEPGTYMFPCAGSMKEMGTPEMKAKLERGPVGHMTLLPPGGYNMGRSLVAWFVYSVIVGLLVAYVAWNSLGATASFTEVFRIAGTAGILGYAVGALQDWIWKGQRGSVTGKFVVDGILYGLATGATFAWLWPEPSLPM